MTRTRTPVAALLAVVSFPVVGRAEELVIPALGVRIADLPGNAAPPQVAARLDGVTAVLQIGAATLYIDRLDAPQAPDSDVGDPAWRATFFGTSYGTTPSAAPGAEPYSQATRVGEHDAWTTAHAQRHGNYVFYSSATYTIVDQHLHLVRATAEGGDTMPPDYAAAVHVMAHLGFIAPDPAEVAKLGTPNGLVMMPKGVGIKSEIDFYPASARYRGAQGIADVDYSIDRNGLARDVRVLYATSADFAKSAQELVKRVSYRVPPDWDQKGYQNGRFTLEVQYRLVSKMPCPPQVPPRVVTSEVVQVCGSALVR